MSDTVYIHGTYAQAPLEDYKSQQYLLFSGCHGDHPAGSSHHSILQSLGVSYVKSRMVESAPEEKTQGCVGWKMTSRTPRSRVISCPRRTFTGTISGFCRRSLRGERRRLERSHVI